MQKTTSNRNFAESGTSENDSELNVELCRKNPSVPSTLLPLPNASAKPTAQKASVPIERLTRIFATTAPTFLPREKPTSSIAKPACIRNTMQPATITHTVSMASLSSSGDIPCLPPLDHEKAAPKFGNGFIAYERATSPSLIHMVQ